MSESIFETEAIEEAIEIVKGGYDFETNALEAAEEVGCIVIYPEPNQLQIDIDSKKQLQHHRKRLNEFKQIWNTLDIYCVKSINKSKSGGEHYHVYLSLFTYEYSEFEKKQIPYNINEQERILLQFALGSDPVRETLNTMRLIAGVKYPTRLFEKKEQEAK